MPLPTTRDITLTPGDPVPSNLLNRLQDMILGARHPALVIPIPARALLPGNANTRLDSAGHWRADGNPGVLYHPIQAPAGTAVASITVYGHTAAAARFRAEVLVKDLTRPDPESPHVLVQTVAAANAPTSLTLAEPAPGMPIISTATTAYTLSIGLDPDLAVHIYGAALTIIRL